MDGIELRPIDQDEFPGFHRRMIQCLGQDATKEDCDALRGVFEPERSLAAFDKGRIVATSALVSRKLTVPGSVVPVAAGMMACVAPTHRRRGLLRAMKERQREDLREQEGLLMSWPSEAPIYGRYGYGMATQQAVMTGHTARLELSQRALWESMTLTEHEVAEALPELAAVYDRVRVCRPGWPDRSATWWPLRLHDPARGRQARTALRVVMCHDRDEVTRGYAIYAVQYRWDTSADSEAQILEVVSESPQAYAALWHFLVGLDLVRHVRWDCAPAADALQHMVTDARAVELRTRDGLWLWLVDLQRALSSRRYQAEVDVVLEVGDAFCPWNAGRWRLAGGRDSAICERTTRPADVRVTAADVAAVYLGGVSLMSLHRAGRVEALRHDALQLLSHAMVSDPAASCPESF